jgi:U4/U6 small nuclear ribonucleoprotein PRP3
MAPDLPNLIIVEGGPRAIKKYKRLMLRRIDWNSKARQRKAETEEDPNQETGAPEEEDKDEEGGVEDDEAKVSKDKLCHLIWEGIQRKKTFEKWRVVDVRSENEAKRLLTEKSCEQFWNMAMTFQPERAEGEEPEQLETVLA